MERQKNLANLLRDKDEQDDEIADQLAGFDWVSANKNRYLVEQEERHGFSKRLMKACVKPCFTNL